MCDSGKYHEKVYDARGIYVTAICEDCEKESLEGYRPDIFTDSNYWHEEPIDED